MTKKWSSSLLIFFLFMYVVISFVEWASHYYLMHGNRIQPLLDALDIKNSHIDHHKETLLDQTLPDPFIEEGLVFNFLDVENLMLAIGVMLSAYLFWRFMPRFKKQYSFTFISGITLVISFLYLYIWSSIHSQYHKRYIVVNQPLVHNPEKTMYSPLPFFQSDSNVLYRYLLWYHTLHHLNKGKKCNYNTECILADFILGTYKSRVDNREYFATHAPENTREEWLRQHPLFEIRVVDQWIEYNDGKEWTRLPRL
jgi:hypothetical protein